MNEVDVEKSFGAEFAATMKRILSNRSVNGVIVTENFREPVFTTMDNNKTFIFANRLSDLCELARQAVKCMDPEDELMVVRVKTPKYEIMNVLPQHDKSIIVLQQLDSP